MRAIAGGGGGGTFEAKGPQELMMMMMMMMMMWWQWTSLSLSGLTGRWMVSGKVKDGGSWSTRPCPSVWWAGYGKLGTVNRSKQESIEDASGNCGNRLR